MAFEANCVGRRIVQAMPLSWSSRSTVRFSSAAPKCGWVWTVRDDTSTTCSTPHRRAAVRTSASGPIRDTRNVARTPSGAGFSDSGTAKSPSTASTPSGNVAREASRGECAPARVGGRLLP